MQATSLQLNAGIMLTSGVRRALEHPYKLYTTYKHEKFEVITTVLHLRRLESSLIIIIIIIIICYFLLWWGDDSM